MSEQVEAAGVTQQAPISIAQGAAMLAERRNAAAGNDDVSDAARKLGQRAAQAREERRAEQQRQAQESSEEEGGNEQDDEAQGNPEGETLSDETANDGSPNETEAKAEGEPEADEATMIDLGDGVKVTLDEVREGFMLKADHTRKTQALAQDREALSQRLAEVDQLLGKLRPAANDHKPRTRADFIKEFGPIDGLDKWDEHSALVGRMTNLAQKAKADAAAAAQVECDRYLAANYNKAWADPKALDARYTELSSFARGLGAHPAQLSQMDEPWMIMALDMAAQFSALQAGRKDVKKVIADKPKVVKPGVKVSAQAQAHSALQAAKDKLKASGSPADAVAYLRAQRKARAG